MQKAWILLVVLVLSTPTFGQEPTRIELATDSPAKASWGTFTYDLTNGPPAESLYKNNVIRFAYNADVLGNKVIPNDVNFGLTFEPKYFAAQFQTEIYYEWTSPNGMIAKQRPWGVVIHHNTGNAFHSVQGPVAYHDHSGNLTGRWLNEGLLDFYTSSGGMRVRNNVFAVQAWNSTVSANVGLLRLNSQNKVVLSSNSVPIVLEGPASGSVLDLSGEYRVGGLKVVGTRCSAIANSNGTPQDDTRAINALLSCLRTHGLLQN